MKTNNACLQRPVCAVVFLALCFTQACAPRFRKGISAYQHRDFATATTIFKHYREHRRLAAAARYYQTRVTLSDTRELPGLLALDQSLIITDSIFRAMPPRKRLRQTRKFEIDTSAILDLREQTQRWAVAGVRARGTLPALDSLLEGLPRPLPVVQPLSDTTRADIVNAHLETADYDTMTAILRRHINWVRPENYDYTRRMQEQLWPAFLEKHTPCALDRFVRDHPLTFAGRDCWRDTIQQLLCTGNLNQMLDFHADNRWTALEIVLLNAIADRAADSAAVSLLNDAQQTRLLDLQRRTALRRQLTGGSADTAAVLTSASDYISRYAPRYSAFRLMEETLQFLLTEHCYASAIALLEQAYPHFSDTLPADCATNFDFQLRVKPWIDGKLPILRQPVRPVAKYPLQELNTPDGEEYLPVVRADGREIFFAGKNRPDNLAGADVFTARRDSPEGAWQASVRVAALSGPGHQEPLALTADACTLLLWNQNKLCLSRRAAPDADWGEAAPLPVSGIAITGKGFLSADGNTLLLEGAYSFGTPVQAPDLDLFVSFRDPAGNTWSRPAALGADINTDGQETSPFLSPDGRTLWYVSTGYPGLGSGDVFVSRRTGDDWTHWTRPQNLGKEWNDTVWHRGFTSVSAAGRTFWWSRDGDLWTGEW